MSAPSASLTPATGSSVGQTASSEWVALVREKVESLHYGVVQLTVHDGRVTQIERTEKTRLAASREGQ